MHRVSTHLIPLIGFAVLMWVAGPAVAQDGETTSGGQTLPGTAGPGDGGEPWQRVNPIRPTFPDNAYVTPVAHLMVSGGYSLGLFEDPLPTLHTIDFAAQLGIIELLEARLLLNVLHIADDDVGLGDLTLGLKGGFLGGWDDNIALAGFVDVTLPTGADPFGLGEGANFFGGMVGTFVVSTIEIDVQVAANLHLFIPDPAFTLPVSGAVSWLVVDRLLINGDVVVDFDFTDLSDTSTSLYGGLGFLITRFLSVDAGARVGLSPDLADVVISAGLAYLTNPLW